MTNTGKELSKDMSRTLIEWNPINSRLMKARFNSKYTKLTVIVCYAPTNTSDEENKGEFYEQLQTAVSEVPAHDKLLVIGDMNGRKNNGEGRLWNKDF